MEVPAATPVTTPEVPTVATDVIPLVQVPPAVMSVSVVVLPTQTEAVPVTAAGTEEPTVTTTETAQPDDNV